MKIFKNDAVYVQKNDLDRLNTNGVPIPESIYFKYIKYINKNTNPFIKFNDIEEINYFNGLDCIIDYNDIKDLTFEELLYKTIDVMKNRDRIHEEFKSLSNKEKMNNLSMYRVLNLEKIKISCLNECIAYKSGVAILDLPKDNEVKKFVKRICNKKVK